MSGNDIEFDNFHTSEALVILVTSRFSGEKTGAGAGTYHPVSVQDMGIDICANEYRGAGQPPDPSRGAGGKSLVPMSFREIELNDCTSSNRWSPAEFHERWSSLVPFPVVARQSVRLTKFKFVHTTFMIEPLFIPT
ncbi:hypothetical protein BK411_12950 [Vibrio splendidus]|nr:hypothetical protein BK411_12950 [Vibrio splendidus]